MFVCSFFLCVCLCFLRLKLIKFAFYRLATSIHSHDSLLKLTDVDWIYVYTSNSLSEFKFWSYRWNLTQTFVRNSDEIIVIFIILFAVSNCFLYNELRMLQWSLLKLSVSFSTFILLPYNFLISFIRPSYSYFSPLSFPHCPLR